MKIMSEQKLDHLGVLDYISLEERADEFFPSSWPKEKIDTSVMTEFQLNTRFVGIRCKEVVPTDKDISNLVSAIKEQHGDNIHGWLLKLGYLMVPEFIGDEPTISEYLDGSFDPSRVKPVAMLISYPIVKEV